MRYTIIDNDGTVSFIAPWNTLKALVAACSRKPAPNDLSTLLEAASRYSSGLQEYVLNGLAVFGEHHALATSGESVGELNPRLEQELAELLGGDPDPAPAEPEELDELPAFGNPDDAAEISYEALLEKQQALRGLDPAKHPVLRVVDEATRRESLEPVKIGLVLFNLPAKRIIQIQNNYAVLKRSDRGRYFENGQPTDRLYFYRLPSEWSLLP
jgi:hypothetical protein